MFSSSGNMKGTLVVLYFFVCQSHQRPQTEVSDDVGPPTTTVAAEADEAVTDTAVVTTTEGRTESPDQNGSRQVTQATAVSVRTSVNVSDARGSSPVYGDFKPSRYYRPDGDPIFERPSPPVTREIFYKPQYFRRPDDHRNVAFPQATTQYSEHRQPHGNRTTSDGPAESRPVGPFAGGPPKTAQVLPQYKPVKHDSGEAAPDFSLYGGGGQPHYSRYRPGTEMLSPFPPDVIHEPPMSYHNVVVRKKKDPWKSVLSVLATILPVGLLLASFPPTVIKVNSTQYPYQFQKNSTAYHPNIVTGRYKTVRTKNVGRQINEENEFSGYLNKCLKKKICENIKAIHSPSELTLLLQNNKFSNNTYNGYYSPMADIAKAAASTRPESCQVFVCNE